MSHSRSCGTILAVLCASLISSTVHALANRVFVSARSGNDANTCDNILAPCQTFAGAVTKLNPGGEAIVLDSGGYGAVVITQAVTIEAPPGVLAFIHPSSGDGITVNAGGSDTVVLRGLVLNGGTGHGITVNTVGVLHVENCVISGFAGDGLDFAATAQLFVKDTIARGNGVDGILVNPGAGSAKASIDHCRLEKNGLYGLSSQSTVPTAPFHAQVTIRDSVASANVVGLYAVDGELNVESCLVANNATGIGIGFGAGLIRVSNSTVTDNTTGISPDSGTLVTRLNNTVEGNTTDGTFTGNYSPK